jgi:hypothetical protein
LEISFLNSPTRSSNDILCDLIEKYVDSVPNYDGLKHRVVVSQEVLHESHLFGQLPWFTEGLVKTFESPEGLTKVLFFNAGSIH